MTSKTYFSVMNDKGMVMYAMKYWLRSCFIASLMLMSCLVLEAQEEITVQDSIVSNLAVQDTVVLKKLPVMETRWLLFDMGWNQFNYSYGNQDYTPVELNVAKSFQFELNVFRQKISLYRNQLNLEYGFALQFNRYELKNNYILAPYSGAVQFNPGTVEYKKNSLNTTSFVVPFMLQFEQKPRKRLHSFRLGAGAYAGFVVSSKNKLRSDAGKTNVKGDFNLNDFKYGLVAEGGYGYVTLFYKFELSPFFVASQNSNYKLHVMSFGIRLIPYF